MIVWHVEHFDDVYDAQVEVVTFYIIYYNIITAEVVRLQFISKIVNNFLLDEFPTKF